VRILVVDDDAGIRFLVHAALDGWEVLIAADGAAALAVLDEQTVDAVVLDVMMPAPDGFEVLRRIREGGATAQVPVVLLTAKAGDDEHLAGFRGGADAYLTKPFDIDVLEATLLEVTTRSAADRAAGRSTELERAELLQQLSRAFEG
jgi:two-component system response regulator MprA